MRCIWCAAFLGAASAALAQSSDPAALYSAIRASVGETISNEPAFTGIPRAAGDAYDLVTCRTAMDLGMSYDHQLALPTTIALDATIYSRDFTRLGIPQSVWMNGVSAIDRIGAAAVQDRLRLPRSQWERAAEQREAELERARERLLNDLESFRQRGQRLPEFISEGGCGAGEVEVDITTSPRGATVRYIPVFSYKLCEARRINPEDPRQCDGWLTAVKVAETLAGKYHFIAQWPDGTQRTGIFDITGKTSIRISQ